MTSVKKLSLQGGGYTLVDAHHYDRLMQYEWFQSKQHVYRRAGDTLIALHHEILPPPDGMVIDHINRNGLDNREINLRVATHQQNSCNRTQPRNNTSGFKGVFREKRTGKWRACIRVNGRREYLGTYETKEQAAHAYDAAARHHFGAFAWLNYPTVHLPYKPIRKTSVYRGVSLDRRSGKWVATLAVNKVRVLQAAFDDELEAALAYDAAARKHLGGKARLNFPDGLPQQAA